MRLSALPLIAAVSIALASVEARAASCASVDAGPTTAPQWGSSGVPRNVEIAVFFEKWQWAPGNVNLSLHDAAGVRVPSDVAPVGECCGTFRVRPAFLLDAQALYELRWTPSSDAGGFVVSRFTTGAVTDVTPPAFAGIESARYWAPDQYHPSAVWHLALGPATDDATDDEALYYRVFVGRDGGEVDRSAAGALIRPSRFVFTPNQVLLGDGFCMTGNLQIARHEALTVEIEAVDEAGNGSIRYALALVPTPLDGGYLYPDGGTVTDGGSVAPIPDARPAAADAGTAPSDAGVAPPDGGHSLGGGCGAAGGLAPFAIGVVAFGLVVGRRARGPRGLS